MDKIDTYWVKIPFLGKIFQRMFSYFREHTAIADFIHLCLGAALPLLMLGYYTWAIPLLVIGIGGHIVAYSKGKNST